jgi:hypothetical protein
MRLMAHCTALGRLAVQIGREHAEGSARSAEVDGGLEGAIAVAEEQREGAAGDQGDIRDAVAIDVGDHSRRSAFVQRPGDAAVAGEGPLAVPQVHVRALALGVDADKSRH